MKDTWTIACIADTHTYERQIALPKADAIIHAGDATFRGTLIEVERFCHWYGQLPYRHKIFVAGNHDWLFEEQAGLAKQICRDNGIVYLEDRFEELYAPDITKPLQIYGTPIQPIFCDWAFNREEEVQEEYFKQIPAGLDVLVTHCPPFGVLDEVCHDFKQQWVGSRPLLDAVQARPPRYHVFGHIHPQYGIKRRGDTTFINASTCDSHYSPTHAPILIEV